MRKEFGRAKPILSITTVTSISSSRHTWTHVTFRHHLSTSLQQKFCCGGMTTHCCIMKGRCSILHINSYHRQSVNADLAAWHVPSMWCPSSLLSTLVSKSLDHTMSVGFKLFQTHSNIFTYRFKKMWIDVKLSTIKNSPPEVHPLALMYIDYCRSYIHRIIIIILF